MQGDPPKGKPSLWARAVIGGEQVLICPECQREHPSWVDEATACPRCGYRKLALKLGHVVCSKCGHDWEP